MLAQQFQILLTFFLFDCFFAGVCLANGMTELILSPKEKQTFDKFKDKVMPILTEDYMKTECYLVRWLRAKDFVPLAAETMLIQNLKWRKDNKMSTILSENFEDMKMDFPSTVDTCDKTGRPISTLDMSQWSIRNAIVSGRSKRLLRYIHMLLETSTIQVLERQRKGMNVTQWMTLMHADGVNMIHHGCPMCISIWTQFMYSLDNYYPGWMHEFIAIEASPALQIILNLLSPIASRYIADNIHIFGNERHKWMQYLDSKIAREERSELYGGIKN